MCKPSRAPPSKIEYRGAPKGLPPPPAGWQKFRIQPCKWPPQKLPRRSWPKLTTREMILRIFCTIFVSHLTLCIHDPRRHTCMNQNFRDFWKKISRHLISQSFANKMAMMLIDGLKCSWDNYLSNEPSSRSIEAVLVVPRDQTSQKVRCVHALCPPPRPATFWVISQRGFMPWVDVKSELGFSHMGNLSTPLVLPENPPLFVCTVIWVVCPPPAGKSVPPPAGRNFQVLNFDNIAQINDIASTASTAVSRKGKRGVKRGFFGQMEYYGTIRTLGVPLATFRNFGTISGEKICRESVITACN